MHMMQFHDWLFAEPSGLSDEIEFHSLMQITDISWFIPVANEQFAVAEQIY